MQLTLLPGYPDLIGRRAAFVGYGAGPASYSQTTGDPISIPGKYIDIVLEAAQDPTGSYFAIARPSFNGPRATWTLHWYNSSNSTEVSNATNLSTYSLMIGGFYGEY